MYTGFHPWNALNVCWAEYGNFTDEKFTWVSNEHCMLLVGYDEKGCWFNDPYDGNGVIRYPWDTVRASHAAQHSMAAGVKYI